MPRLTILLPTYNRAHYLARQLDYLTASFDGGLCRVMVLDGSSDAVEREKNRQLAQTHLADYGWYDSKIYAGYARMVDALEKTDTEYAIFMPDDDYYVFSSVVRCVEELDRQPDVVGVFGADVMVNIDTGSDTRTLQLMSLGEGEKLDYGFSSPFARMLFAMGEVQRSTYFSVYRREVLYRAFKAALDHSVIPQPDDDMVDPKCFYFGDIIAGFVPMLYGKMVHVDAPVCAYEVGQSVDNGRRVHHGTLINDESFEYAARTRMFVDGMIKETQAAGIEANIETLRGFYTNLLATLIGRIAFTNGLVADYNALLGAEHYSDQFHAGFMGMKSHDAVTLDEARTGEGEVSRFYRRFDVCLDHLADWIDATHVSYLAIPYPEENLYRGLHSRLRPHPFGTVGWSAAAK